MTAVPAESAIPALVLSLSLVLGPPKRAQGLRNRGRLSLGKDALGGVEEFGALAGKAVLADSGFTFDDGIVFFYRLGFVFVGSGLGENFVLVRLRLLSTSVGARVCT